MAQGTDLTRLYEQMQIRTASAPRRICILHEKSVYLIQQALGADGEIQRSLLNRAQNILATLERSLIVDDKVSEGLFCLYDYCYCNLESTEIDKLTAAIAILSQLRDTFHYLYKNR